MGIARDLARLRANATGQIPAANIQDNSITTAKIIDNAITTAKIIDDAINAAKIAASAVGNSEIQNNSVTGAKVNNEIFKNYQGQFPDTNNQNLNDWLTPGGYNYVIGSFTGSTNVPPSGAYGTLLVFNVGSFTTQMVFMHAGGGSFGYHRTKYNAGGNNDYWMSWSAF